MSATLVERGSKVRTAPRIAAVHGAHRHWFWLAGGLALAFAVPFLLSDVLSVERDVYYGMYAAVVFGFFALWLRLAVDAPLATLTHNWRAGVLLGIAFGAVVSAIVLAERATAHPHGLRFVGAVLWRGIVYGAADGVLLSVFPILAVFAVFASRPLRERRRRARIAIGALALAVSLLFTTVYHLGYPDFRGSKVRKPLIGDVAWSAPTLLTLSPIGAPIAHIALHVTAVVHSYETNTFLPPHRRQAH
jgi:hypothetical protein